MMEPIPELSVPKERLSFNITAFRLMYVYYLLSQARELSYADLNTHLINRPEIQRSIAKDTLNKYIHTLQLFGCFVSKFEQQGQAMYRLLEHPLQLELSEEETNAIKAVLDVLLQQPLRSEFKNFYNLLNQLALLPQPLKQYGENHLGLGLSASIPRDVMELVESLQKCCLEGQILEVAYAQPDESFTLKLIEPQEVVYHKKHLYLLGNDPNKKEKVRLKVELIRSHRQLPSRVRSQTNRTVVTFKLTGRLAANYRPYPGETLANKEEFLLVKHETDEVTLLLRRLMKYGEHCQVLSPGWARQHMHHIIESLLAEL